MVVGEGAAACDVRSPPLESKAHREGTLRNKPKSGTGCFRVLRRHLEPTAGTWQSPFFCYRTALLCSLNSPSTIPGDIPMVSYPQARELRFYNKRGTAEESIKEGKPAVKMARGTRAQTTKGPDRSGPFLVLGRKNAITRGTSGAESRYQTGPYPTA